MSWWDSGLSNFANQATQALQKAQKQIDKVLDIKEEDGGPSNTIIQDSSGTLLKCSQTMSIIVPLVPSAPYTCTLLVTLQRPHTFVENTRSCTFKHTNVFLTVFIH